MRFEFAAPARIIFGDGTLKEAVTTVRKSGRHALLVVGGGDLVIEKLREAIANVGMTYTILRVEGEPSVESIQAGVRSAKDSGADVILGCGGGSAIDSAKAIACLATNPGDILDYLEVVGGGQALAQPGLALVAVPTTAGTGSEVTRNAVLAVPEKRMKVSLRSSYMYPHLVVIDPELTYSVPPDVTASTGMDALAQVLEPFVSLRANRMADLYCQAGMEAIGGSLLRVYADGQDAAARREMCWGSLMGGLALANAGLGAVHGFASPMGGMFPIPHGVVCALLLAPVVEANLRAMRARAPLNPAVERYAASARMILGNPKAEPADLVTWLNQICLEMRIPRLHEFGIRSEHFDEIIENAKKASSMLANPLPLMSDELKEILEKAL